MTVRSRSARAPAVWLSIADVARELGVSMQTVRRKVRNGSIPGGERMYAYEERDGERWHVSAEVFKAWRKAVQERAAG